jgi:hypothetical protein
VLQQHNPGEIHKIQKTNSPKKPRRLLLLGPLAIGITGFALIFSCSGRYGVGLSADSVSYIAVARNLLNSHSFLNLSGSILKEWPPLYPLVIAGFKLCGSNDFLAVRLISALSFGLIIFLSGLWVLRYSGSLTFSVISSICILLSKPLAAVCYQAWSEPVFILLIIIFLILMPRLVDKPTFKAMLVLSIVTSAVCLTRYIGIVLFPVGAVILFSGIKHLRKKLIFTAGWGLLSAVPLGIWLIRNWILTGTLSGSRAPATITLSENINLAGNTIASWFIPTGVENLIPGWLLFVLFCIFVSAIFAVNIHKTIKSEKIDWPINTVLLFLIVYTITILYAVTTTGMDFLDDRFLSPIYPAIVILSWGFIANLFGSVLKPSQAKNWSGRKIARYGLIVGISTGIWFGTGLNHTILISKRTSESGVGFASSFWKNSETIAWLKSNHLNGRIYTNDLYGIYIMADIKANMVPTRLDHSPNLLETNRNFIEQQIIEFKSALKSGDNVYLVWFLSHFRKYLYDPNQLQEFCDVKVIKKLNDGLIIALYPKSDSDKN